MGGQHESTQQVPVSTALMNMPVHRDEGPEGPVRTVTQASISGPRDPVTESPVLPYQILHPPYAPDDSLSFPLMAEQGSFLTLSGRALRGQCVTRQHSEQKKMVMEKKATGPAGHSTYRMSPWDGRARGPSVPMAGWGSALELLAHLRPVWPPWGRGHRTPSETSLCHSLQRF